VTKTVTSVSVRLGALLALVGGFLDAYTYVSRDHVFANSQTGNLVLFGVEAARGQWSKAVLHLPPVVAFIVGVAAAETLKRPPVARVVVRPARVALFLEIVVLLIVGALPRSMPSSIVTVSIAFVASVQVSTFRTLVKWPYNNTMATGNLRTAVQAVYLAMVDRDPDAAAQARAFCSVMVSFLAGALGGAWLTYLFDVRAAWISAVLLAAGIALFAIDERDEAQGASGPELAGRFGVDNGAETREERSS
jgi:uncharacterized membrane protein YoaK (UPF0700 family)